MLDFDTLRQANVGRCEESFHPLNAWGIADWAVAMAGECGEACNAVKKLRRMETHTSLPGDPQTWPEGLLAVAAELADTVIYADLLAARLGINLGESVRVKFNVVSQKVESRYRL